MDTGEQKNQSLTSGISGDVKSVDGKILSGARVSCNGVETKTLADGTFTIDNLEPGTYDLSFSLQGYESLQKSVSIQEGDNIKLSFTLQKSVGYARIHGHVYDSELKEGIKKGGSIVLVKPIFNEYGQIDRRGYFEFGNLPDGEYKILVSIPGYISSCATIEVADGEEKTHDFLVTPLDIEEPPWG